MKYKLVIMTMLFAANTTAQTAIDVHSHIITPEYVEVLRENHAELEEGFPVPQWSAESHLQFMDAAGIKCSVLTLSAPQPFFGNAGESSHCIRQVNEASARLKAAHPDRFKFCAALPLPDVAAAVREVVYALDTLHADGIKLATNSRGQYLGDEALDTLMKVLDERHAVVIVHPHRPTPYETKLMQNTPLAMSEYPAETTRAVLNMISRNVLARYPNVKVVVPHCGSYLPLAVPRMKAVYPAVHAKGLVQTIDWEANLSRLYYDLAGGASPEIIKIMLSITTPDHILYGSDYPYISADVLTKNKQRLTDALSHDPQLAPYAEMFLHENAERLFGGGK